MKTMLMNTLLIPGWIALLVATGCLYWDYKFHAQALKAENDFSVLEAGIKTIECPTVNKDVVLTIARNSIEQGQRFGDLSRSGAILFLGIGFINFVLILRHLKRDHKTS